MLNLATKAGVEGRSRVQIHTPLIAANKAATERRASALGVDPGSGAAATIRSPAGARAAPGVLHPAGGQTEASPGAPALKTVGLSQSSENVVLTVRPSG